MSGTHNIFVSHRQEDEAHVEALKQLMRDHNVDIRDSSITTSNPNKAKDPDYVKQGILGPRIRWAGKVLVIITPETKNHPFVDWEVEYASKLGDKRIIGVWAPGAEKCDIPEALERHADAVVPWNLEKILDAINGQDNWEQADGSPRAPQPITRIGC